MTSRTAGEHTSVDELPSIMLTVPFWSNLGYLSEALSSAIEQTDADWTLVVVDDASPEIGAADVVDSFGDARLSYVRNDVNLGVAGNFNRCFDLARTAGVDIVAIFHADDLLESGYVAVVRAAHAAHSQAACVAPKVTVIDGGGQPTRTIADTVKSWMWPDQARTPTLVGDDGLARLLRGQFFYCPAVSYRLSSMGAISWEPRWQQVMDLELYGRVLLKGDTIVLEGRHIYRYRRHSGTTTESNSVTMVRSDEEREVCRELGSVARARGWHRAARAGRIRLMPRMQAGLRAAQFVVGRQWALARRALGAASGR